MYLIIDGTSLGLSFSVCVGQGLACLALLLLPAPSLQKSATQVHQPPSRRQCASLCSGSGSPSPWPAPGLPVLFCTSLLPGDRPTKNILAAFLAHSCPKCRKRGGAGRPRSLLSPTNCLPRTLSSTPAWGYCQLGHLRGIPHPFPGGGLTTSAHTHRAVRGPRERGGERSGGKPSQFLTNQCQPHCGHLEGRAWLRWLVF